MILMKSCFVDSFSRMYSSKSNDMGVRLMSDVSWPARFECSNDKITSYSFPDVVFNPIRNYRAFEIGISLKFTRCLLFNTYAGTTPCDVPNQVYIGSDIGGNMYQYLRFEYTANRTSFYPSSFLLGAAGLANMWFNNPDANTFLYVNGVGFTPHEVQFSWDIAFDGTSYFGIRSCTWGGVQYTRDAYPVELVDFDPEWYPSLYMHLDRWDACNELYHRAAIVEIFGVA